MRKFKEVSDYYKKTNGVPTLPKRATIGSGGYDFYSNSDYTVQPNQIAKVWTDVKCYMEPDDVLILDVRSSMGGKFMLANTIGIIDSTYVDNEDNEGNIGIFLKNISNKVLTISKGDRIAQGIFLKYLITDDDNTTAKRVGGFGSSGK